MCFSIFRERERERQNVSGQVGNDFYSVAQVFFADYKGIMPSQQVIMSTT
jgi:hypothetical protein